MRPPLRIRYAGRRPTPAIRRRLDRMTQRIVGAVDLRHPLEVTYCSARTLSVEGRISAFGVFIATHRKGTTPRVAVARYVERIPGAGRTVLAETLAHELVHYEDFRDGKPQTHRRHDARTHRLMRRAGYRV